MDGGESIEIELTSIEARPGTGGRGRRHTASGGRSGDPEIDGEDRDGSGDWFASDRGKLITTGAVVGVIALLLGWMLGRSSGGDHLAATVDDSPTTIAERPTTLPIVGDTIKPPDFADAENDPTTTRPDRATTTVPPGPTTEPIEIDPRLRGIPLRLVVAGFTGELFEIDLERGVRTDYHTLSRSFDPSSVAAGDDWIIANGGESMVTRVMWSDGSESELDSLGYWRLMPIEGTDLVWRLAGDFGAGPIFQLTDVNGDEVLPGVIEPPSGAWPIATDPAGGGLIVQTNGRVYSMLPDETNYIGIGSVVAVSADRILLADCDEQLVCGLHLVDRSTGDVLVVPDDDPVGDTFHSIFDWGAGNSSGFSPDSRWATVMRDGANHSEFGMVDVETGDFVTLTRDSYLPVAVWTPDSRFVIYLDNNQRMSAHDLASGDHFEVLAEKRQWQVLTARPASATTDDTVEG